MPIADKSFATHFFPLRIEDESFRKNFNDSRSNSAKLKISLFGNKPKLNPKDNILPKFFDYLRAADKEILIRLAEHDEEINKLCQHENMKDHWNNAWSKMWKQPTDEATNNPELKDQGLRLQLGMSPFDLVRGRFFYEQAEIENLKGNPSTASAFLEKAAEYKCFEAIWTLTDLNYKKLENNNDFTPSQLKEMTTVIEGFIIPHGTPAFLLLASISFFIAKYYTRQKHLTAASSSLQCALQYLYAAGFCHDQDFSKDATHNAYNGSNIAKTIGGLSINIDNLFKVANSNCEKYHMAEYIGVMMGKGKEIAKEKFTKWAVETSAAKDIGMNLTAACMLTNKLR